MILLIISLRQLIYTFTPKYAVLASTACCLPTTWTVILVQLKGNPNFQFSEQEIKVFIWGKVLLCSFFYIVNLNLYGFGPHPVGDYGCQMGQSFRVNHFEWELRVGRRPR